jgi:hypothetical protein
LACWRTRKAYLSMKLASPAFSNARNKRDRSHTAPIPVGEYT